MKTKLLILLLFLLPFFGNSQGWWNAAPAVTVNYPVYEGNGGIAADGGFSVDVPYPATINANDILIAQLLDADNDAFLAPPGDWVLIYQEGANTNASHAYFWKRATGSELGTQTFTSLLNAGSGVYGVMSRYSGCITSGTPYEDATGVPVIQTSTPTIPAMTSTGFRLAVGFITIEDNISLSGHTGYVSIYQETSSFGGDANLAAAEEQVSTGATVADVLSLSTTEYVGVLGILLIPAE